jgi:hypothetical protein
MFSIFTKILCAITNVAWWLCDLLVMLCNLFMATLGAAVAAVLGLLPDMPDPPGGIASDVLLWANWMFPIAALVAMFSVYFALYLAARLFMAAIRLADRLGVTR